MDICKYPNSCILKETALSHPEKCAIITDGREWTYAALDHEVDVLCGKAKDITPEFWAISATASVDTIIRIFAGLRLGISICLLNARFARPDSIPPISFGKGIFFFSSGTTGKPKIAFHTVEGLITNALGVNAYLNIDEHDRYQLSLPLHHTAGIGILFRSFLTRAALVISSDPLDTRSNLLSLVPTQLYRILKQKTLIPPGLKAVLVGGSTIRDELLNEAHLAGIPTFTTYALTEMGSTVCLSKDTHFHYPLPNRELLINSEGEIYVRGQTLFQGYWTNGILSLPVDSDGWFATGDLAQIHPNGTWSFLGRKDSMFICGGENLYPEEIERALLKLPGVMDACVVGITDLEWGSKPVAFVQHVEKNYPLETLKEQLRETLPTIKIPARFFPLDPTQFHGIKPSRALLKQLAQVESFK